MKNTKNTKKIQLGIIRIILITSILLILAGVVLLNIMGNRKIFGGATKGGHLFQENESDMTSESGDVLNIEGEIIRRIDDNNMDILVTATSSTGIEKIILPTGETEINGNGKNKIAIDYKITSGVDYKFKVIGTNGKEVEKTITTAMKDIYKIEDLENLEDITKGINYRLMNSLDFKDRNSYNTQERYEYYNIDSDGDGNPDNSWTPIGTVEKPFYGTLDGDYKSIIGVYVNTDSDYQGLFGAIENGTVKNLNLSGAVGKIDKSYVGILAGASAGTIENVVVKSDSIVLGLNYVGGLVGNSSIDACITNSKNYGSVKGGKYVGGITGKGGTIAQSCNEAQVLIEGSLGHVGGISGSNSNISYCYNKGNVKGNGNDGTGYSSVGGIIGTRRPNTALLQYRKRLWSKGSSSRNKGKWVRQWN